MPISCAQANIQERYKLCSYWPARWHCCWLWCTEVHSRCELIHVSLEWDAHTDQVYPWRIMIPWIALQQLQLEVYNGQIHPVAAPLNHLHNGDKEGHDCHCGHYTACFSSLAQPFCVCECPTLKCGYSKAKYRHRKPAVINTLVQLGDLNGLKAMPQNYLVNGFDQACFGLRNNRGMFGLHALARCYISFLWAGSNIVSKPSVRK